MREKFGSRLWLGAICLLGALWAPPAQAMWITGYYPGWRQSRMTPADIDFGALSHLAHFAVVPRQDGSLDASINLMTKANMQAAVLAAHKSGKKVLFTVGGQNSRATFVSAISPRYRDFFIGTLIDFMREYEYDGIDLDMEEIRPEDADDYAAFVRKLRGEMTKANPSALLTAAVLWEPELFGRLAGYFDQINLMTYNLSGPYPGWVVWHSGPLYDGGRVFPGSDKRLPSVAGVVDAFLAAGVPRAKLGIGLSFNAYIWTGGGVHRPGQAWDRAPVMRVEPYHSVADTYRITPGAANGPGYHWDDQAKAPYISLPSPDPDASEFVSFQNEETVAAMIEFIRSNRLGGLIIWDLSAGYRPAEPRANRDRLLQSVKQAGRSARGKRR